MTYQTKTGFGPNQKPHQTPRPTGLATPKANTAGSAPRKGTFKVPKNYSEMLAATPLGGGPVPWLSADASNPYQTRPQTPHQAPQPPVFAAPAPGLAPTQAAPQQMPGMVAPDGVQPF